MASETGTPLVELTGVSKYYGNHRALNRVDLQVHPHEVVGLVGDNGSGKSTLLKIVTGYHAPTAGEMAFLGESVRFRSPAAARRAGIETVYQDLALIDDLTLWRNFFLGRELVRARWPVRMLRRREMRRICTSELDALGLVHVRSTNAVAAALSGGEKQSLAIARAIHFGARLLLLDEPTAALSVRETRNVLSIIERAREEGLGVIYIDHNVDHVYPVADRIVLLEHGEVAATFRPSEKTPDEVRELIARKTLAPSVWKALR